MLLLVLFGFIAGAATALSPCVLPVLPVALSAGATGGRRRPLGVVSGLVVSFTFATVALVYVIDALGLPDKLVRYVAIAVLAVFGLVLLVPPAAARLEAAISRILPGGPARLDGEGFGSGVLLGLSLGLVYAPCAGPILAGVITVSASQDFTAGRLAVALAYSLGSAGVLYALMLGGRRLAAPLARRAQAFQAAMGVVMVCVAVLMAFEVDLRFQSTIADDLPGVLVNPTKDLEDSTAARDRLADLRKDRSPIRASGGGSESVRSGLPVLGNAPEIRATQRWFNTPRGRPLSLGELHGRVVLIDFWTYSCINCLRTLPYVKAWDRRYRKDGLTVIGMHAPEFAFERDAGNVRRAVRSNGIRYPVGQDNDFDTWNAYGNQYWPAKYLIDAAGRVRYTHFGEGEYGKTEKAIRALLREAGRERLGARTREHAEKPSKLATPESYLGAERADRFVNGRIEEGAHRFRLPRRGLRAIPPSHLAFEGPWRIRRQSAVAGPGARLRLRFTAKRVFLVLGSPGDRPRTVGVRVDGKARRPVRVTTHRLYEVVALPRAGTHLLTLTPERGTEGYAFTFG